MHAIILGSDKLGVCATYIQLLTTKTSSDEHRDKLIGEKENTSIYEPCIPPYLQQHFDIDQVVTTIDQKSHRVRWMK